MKNKRGDLATTVLVFLVVTLCAAALYSFAVTNSEVEKKIQDINYAESAYIIADSFEFGMEGSVRQAYLETYLEFLINEEYSYINSGRKIPDVYYFDSLHSKLNERFKELFLEKLNIDEEYKKKVVVEFSDDLFRVTFKDMEFGSEGGGYVVHYRTDIVYEYNFMDQGIIGFEKLNEVKDKCASFDEVDEVKGCFEGKFKNFKATVTEIGEDEKYFNVVLENDKARLNFLIKRLVLQNAIK